MSAAVVWNFEMLSEFFSAYVAREPLFGGLVRNTLGLAVSFLSA